MVILRTNFLKICFCTVISCVFFSVLHAEAQSTGTPEAKTLPPEYELVLLQFGSEQCASCKRAQPLVDVLVAKNYPIRYIDADRQRDLAEQFRITKLPTFVLTIGGREIERLEDVPEPMLQAQLIRMCKSGKEQILKNIASRRQELSYNMRNEGNTPQPTQFPEPQMRHPNAPVTPVNAVVPVDPRMQQPQHNPNIEKSMAASVRILVGEANNRDTGTGTIIDARGGEAFILTCGHIFRRNGKNGPVEVHLFQGDTYYRVEGECLSYDLGNDIAFVKIAPPFPVRAVPMASVDQLQPGEALLSIGCDQGRDPTIREHRILSLDTFHSAEARERFNYIQVSGAPVQGRSGGGLFDASGALVGVCNTCDPESNTGLFVPLHVIRNQLDRESFSAIHKSPSLTDPTFESRNAITLASHEPQPGFAEPNPPFAENHDTVETMPLGLSDEEQATLEEIRERQASGAEVIVIITPKGKTNDRSQSEIIKLSSASPEFINTLMDKRVTKNGSRHLSLTDQAAALSNPASPASMLQKQRETSFRSQR